MNALTQRTENSLSALLKQPAYADRFKEVLRENSPQFVSSLLSLGATMRDVEPRSIIASAMNAAALDLPINKDLGFAWIIPYKSKGIKYAQFQLGSKGYQQLALRSGQYQRMNAEPINAEAFAGYDECGEPKIDWGKLDFTKPAVGYAFVFKLVNGFIKTAYWPRERVVAHAQRFSQSYRSGADIWRDHFDGMALKTVVKNTLSDWGILSVHMQRAMQADQAVFTDIDAPPQYADNPDEAEEAAMGLAPMKTAEALLEPETTKPAKTTPQQELASFVIAQGFTFDNFRAWAVGSGQIEDKDADNVQSFDDVDAKLAQRLLRASTGLVSGLKGAKA